MRSFFLYLTILFFYALDFFKINFFILCDKYYSIFKDLLNKITSKAYLTNGGPKWT